MFTTANLSDPCNNYTVLNDTWRSISNRPGSNCDADEARSNATNHTADSAARSGGNPGISGLDGGCLARTDGNPATSSHDEDYSSYLTLMATLPDDSSDDEELQQAIMASMESQK